MFKKSTIILLATAVALVGIGVWCLIPGDTDTPGDGKGVESATLQDVGTPLSDVSEAEASASDADVASSELASVQAGADAGADSDSDSGAKSSEKVGTSSGVGSGADANTKDGSTPDGNASASSGSGAKPVSGVSSGSSVSSGTNENASTSGATDKYQTEPVPVGKPEPVEPQKEEPASPKTYSCTIYIECGKLLEGDNIAKLDKNKLGIVPANGVILSKLTVTFSEGDSVFDVLLRETKANKIHMEFVNTPIYNSAYIEGIANLYEFDAGNLSGWVYSVNDWFPNYGSSRYQLKDGDKIEWHYTLDIGRDFGLNF